MKLYLMQHGEALREEEHPERPLTERGKEDVERVAAFLARAGIRIDLIRHSGKLRAAETANIVARQLRIPEVVAAVSGINPNDDVQPVAEELQRETQAIMLVGHLPFLSRLASYLLAGEPGKALVQFQMGGVVCLAQQEGQWGFAWMVVPELLR